VRLAALAAVLAVAAVAPAAGARPFSGGAASVGIAISNGKPAPAKAAIVPGGSVTWRNRDARAHRVRSDENSWRVFTLRAGASKTIRFAQRGCYRYSVDGKARGVVAVKAVCVVTLPRTVVLPYRVGVVGHVRETRTTTGAAADRNGTLTLALDWRGTFPRVTVEKLAIGRTLSLRLNPRRDDNGTIAGSHSFADTRPATACRGTVEIAGLTAFLTGAAHRVSSPRVSELLLTSQLTLESRASVTSQISTAQEAACDGAAKGMPAAPSAGSIVRGLTVSAFVPRFELAVERIDPRAGIWWPLDQLAAGRAFTVDTGVVAGTTNCGATTCSSETQLKLTFTPLR
jgi:plastocyanin